jgi:methionyl-tRNA formyltransferase
VRVVWVSFDVTGRDCLEAAADVGAEVVAVVTLPGPVDPNRSGQCSFDEVAERLGARLVQTTDVNAPETVAAVAETAPELGFVVGWSQLVREDFIALAPRGTFGMHPTLLPRHRGRAPIPWTILSGLAKTGVTLFEITDPTADSGPIVGQVEIPVERDETATTLYAKILDAHLALVREYVPLLLAGTAPSTPQDPRRASTWPKRTPMDGLIDWETRAPYLDDWVRAQTRPYPGAFTFAGDVRLTVWRAAEVESGEAGDAGVILERCSEGIVVACGKGAILLQEVELEGEPPIEGEAVGDRLGVGERLG